MTTKQMIEELKELLNSKYGGLKPGSNTNKTYYSILALFDQVAEAAKAEERELLIDGGWIMAPAAYRGGNDKKLLQVYAPMWEKNMEMLIEVCLCDKCPDSVPRLKEIAKDFNLALFYKDDDGKYASVKALLNNHEAK